MGSTTTLAAPIPRVAQKQLRCTTDVAAQRAAIGPMTNGRSPVNIPDFADHPHRIDERHSADPENRMNRQNIAAVRAGRAVPREVSATHPVTECRMSVIR